MFRNIILSVGFIFLVPSVGFSNNLHVVDSESANGFAIFRTGAPKAQDMKQFCDLGIQEMMVLSGNAQDKEEKLQQYCPSLKVVYNEKQNPNQPVTKEFLGQFDRWVQEAQAQGKKIAFRCNCGCHRTGRLAAYYQMKYQHLTAQDAIAIMKANGKYMWMYPSLQPQVRALYSYIHGQPCREDKKYCVMAASQLQKFNYPEYTEGEESFEENN